ncbi:MAG: hypothetical protein PHC95_15115 [Parabacteroides sp.]|nr:hypothetical protein [Parabacteroides sp.]
MADKDRIILGSGKVYITEFTGEIPADATVEVAGNLLGYISGGATLEYKPSYTKAKDDLGIVSKTILTEEEATFKTGILTFNGETLAKLCNTGRVSVADGIRTVKIGGVDNYDGKKYLIHFVHSDEADGDIRVSIVGVNEAGFSLAFQKDKETVIDAEFACQSMDNEGTLIIFKEETTAVA